MKKSWIVIGAIVVVLVIIVGWCISTYNGMFTEETKVDESWANVESQYQRRKDLIPNLEKTVKAFAKHEEKTFVDVTKARTAAARAQQVADGLPKEVPADQQELDRYMAAQNEAKRTLDIYVNAVTEAYPELKSNQNFMDFQENLTGTENRIQVARTNYNEAVKNYNLKVGRFPGKMVAGLFGFQKKSMFRADADASLAPSVFDEE